MTISFAVVLGAVFGGAAVGAVEGEALAGTFDCWLKV